MNRRPPSHVLAILLLALALRAAPTAAATIGFDPTSAAPAPGGSFVVDVVVSDLGGEIVSAYDLDIVFDPSLLQVDFVSQSTVLGDPALFEALLDAGTAPGLVDIAGLSLLSDAALAARQGGSAVTLASVGFRVIGSGTTTLDFAFDATNDVKGREARILPLTAVPARIGPEEAPIPEPAAALGFGTGLLLVGLAARRDRAPGRR